MPRRREVPKRVILDDPKFSSQEVSKFVNVIMSSGKKSVAERIIYGAFDQIKTKSGKDPLETFSLALEKFQIAHFFDFNINPKYEDLLKGLDLKMNFNNIFL